MRFGFLLYTVLIASCLMTTPVFAQQEQQQGGILNQILSRANQPEKPTQTLQVTKSAPTPQEIEIQQFTMRMNQEADRQQQQWNQEFKKSLSEAISPEQILASQQQSQSTSASNGSSGFLGGLLNRNGGSSNGGGGGADMGGAAAMAGASGGADAMGGMPSPDAPQSPDVQKPNRPTIYNKYKKQEDKVPPKLFRDYDAP